MANILNIKRQPINVPIAGINNLRMTAREKVIIEFQSRCSDFRAKLECLITTKVTGVIPSKNIDVANLNIPKGVQLADPTFFRPSNIDMLIGAAMFFDLIKADYRTIGANLPVLRDSHLGWLVAGTIHSDTTADDCQYSQVASIQTLNDSMQKFWQLEEVPTTTSYSVEEQQCEDHFAATHFRDESGRFVIRLPFKDNVSGLDNCRTLALKRFHMPESRLQRNPDLKAQYVDFIQEYQRLGHCREVNETNDDLNRRGYYMPHHAVLRPSSSTTKCRVVFDASAKSSEANLSLNDVLLVGPVVQSDLYAIMLRFRMHEYVLTADITKMYRQIRMHTDDTHYQRIFWRESPTEDLKVLELTTVTYGTASAPYQATRSLLQLANDEAETFPIAARIVENGFYVDDVLTGTNSLNEALEAQRQLKALFQKGGCPIHKYCSNSKAFLDHIPTEEQETLQPLEDNNINQVIKVLDLL
ncbi:uncharacterized protein LOC129728512 [Wyeomyia smithii]|uniref:uncharacterized protein LOC129728512 n=1 Tax=Wyeomyia smithii TaxID=174621 RepID=UPI0024682128|nr:uncharacterized protein LOC129728512 [Wyeomyia smithii]